MYYITIAFYNRKYLKLDIISLFLPTPVVRFCSLHVLSQDIADRSILDFCLVMQLKSIFKQLSLKIFNHFIVKYLSNF